MSIYDIDMSTAEARAKIRSHFTANSHVKDERVKDILIAKGYMELEETLMQWKQKVRGRRSEGTNCESENFLKTSEKAVGKRQQLCEGQEGRSNDCVSRTFLDSLRPSAPPANLGLPYLITNNPFRSLPQAQLMRLFEGVENKWTQEVEVNAEVKTMVGEFEDIKNTIDTNDYSFENVGGGAEKVGIRQKVGKDGVRVL